MPKSLQLNIAEPCHENWQKMTPQQQGRFCGSCQKTVVDFTMMSDQEVLNYFLKADHNVCGRFGDDQLNKELIITEKKKRFSWAYVWNIIVATFLAVKADAQACPPIKEPVAAIDQLPKKIGKVVHVHSSQKPVVLKGAVIDETTNQSVGGASIRIKGTNEGCMADITGKFSFKTNKRNVAVEFSAIGYETQTLQIDEFTKMHDIRVSLKPSYTGLQEVVVTGYGTTTCTFTAGAVSKVYRETVSEKALKNINEWLPVALKKDVNVYPNPVARGNSLTVSLSLKQAGAYKLEILNAAGQVMQIQPLLMQTKEQVINLHTQMAWSAGIYWLRVSSPDVKNVYQSKVLIQ